MDFLQPLVIELGDVDGHQFHGNQWTGGNATEGSNTSKDLTARRMYGAPIAADIHAKALRIEPKITSTLERIAAATGGKLQGAPPPKGHTGPWTNADKYTKTEESILKKIAEKSIGKGMTVEQAAANLGDAVRYTIITPPEQIEQSARQALDQLRDQGFTFVEKGDQATIENYFLKGDDYNGINAVLTSPDGIKVELQMHTQDSWETKEFKTHADYVTMKDTSKPVEERAAAWQRMVDIADSIRFPPPSILSIGRPTRHETPQFSAMQILDIVVTS